MDLVPFANLENPMVYVSLGLALILFALLDFFLFRVFIRFFPRITIVSTEIIALCCYFFGLFIPMLVALLVLFTGIVCFYVANVNDARALSGNNLKGKSSSKEPPFAKRKKPKGEALFDREEMYQKIQTAVFAMSDTKTGALITLEKSDNLDDIIKQSGTIINAPVTPELLQTIFYVGTRLHDGAVIIRNNVMVAASVYFVPTNKPLQGKFGSRHRAAIGISEICDAVTIVVSEETGRISLAVNGELIPVTKDNFYENFTEQMAFVPKTSE